MSTQLGLHGMIRVDEIENLLSTLVGRINDQDEKIRSLELQCQDFAKKNTMLGVFDNIEASIAKLSAKLERVQAAATARLVGTEQMVTAGELSLLNCLQIEKIQHDLTDFAKRQEVESKWVVFGQQYTKDMKAIRDWAAPLDMTLHLSEANKALTTRLGGLENVVGCKVDRSEISNLQALSSRLGLYDTFQDKTVEQLQLVDTKLQRLDDVTKGNAAAGSSHAQSIAELNAHVKKLAPKTETRALAKMVEALERATPQYAHVTAVVELERRVDEAFRGVRTTNDRFPPIEGEVQRLGSELPGKASLRDVRACVLRAHYEDAIAVLGTAVDSKAPTEHLTLAEDRIAELEARLEAEATRVDVAVRFVDWFTNRGTLYEHNMRVIDKHLGNLTRASLPANRTPYEGKIKYTDTIAGEKVDYDG